MTLGQVPGLLEGIQNMLRNIWPALFLVRWGLCQTQGKGAFADFHGNFVTLTTIEIDEMQFWGMGPTRIR